MNANRVIAMVLAVFLFGLPGCTKSKIPKSERLSSAEYAKRRSRIIEFLSQWREKMRHDIFAITKTKSG